MKDSGIAKHVHEKEKNASQVVVVVVANKPKEEVVFSSYCWSNLESEPVVKYRVMLK